MSYFKGFSNKEVSLLAYAAEAYIMTNGGVSLQPFLSNNEYKYSKVYDKAIQSMINKKPNKTAAYAIKNAKECIRAWQAYRG